eukprot:1161579-Pelagomonas_calceolata.AAC.18
MSVVCNTLCGLTHRAVWQPERDRGQSVQALAVQAFMVRYHGLAGDEHLAPLAQPSTVISRQVGPFMVPWSSWAAAAAAAAAAQQMQQHNTELLAFHTEFHQPFDITGGMELLNHRVGLAFFTHETSTTSWSEPVAFAHVKRALSMAPPPPPPTSPLSKHHHRHHLMHTCGADRSCVGAMRERLLPRKRRSADSVLATLREKSPCSSGTCTGLPLGSSSPGTSVPGEVGR